MALVWVACSMRDGSVLADLPTLEPSYPYRHTMSNFDTGKANLWLAGAPPNWRHIVEPLNAWIAAFDDEDPLETPIWVGYVVDSILDANLDYVPLDLATAEAYAGRRFTRDETHTTAEGRNSIFASTVAQYIVDGGHYLGDPGADPPIPAGPTRPGIPLTVNVVDGTDPKPSVDLVWQNADNRSVFGRWTELIGQLGGEFTITWAWVIADNGGKALAATLHVGQQIGTRATPGLKPSTTFDMPGPLLGFQQMLDYSEGKGANVVSAYSSGQGETTPYAPDVVAANFGDRPTVEYRYQPAPSISPPAVLQYAQQAAKILAPGARPVTLSVSLARTEGRRYGTDWDMGDDIGYAIEPKRADGTPILAFPDGLEDAGRVLAVELTSPTVITPIIGVPIIYQEGSA